MAGLSTFKYPAGATARQPAGIRGGCRPALQQKPASTILHALLHGCSVLLIRWATLKNLLFICSRNKLRSPTAEQVFATWKGMETDSAGLAPDADRVLSVEQLEWASIIFVMEKAHKNKLSRDYSQHIKGKRVIILGIPDDYDFMDPELTRLLEASVGPYLRRSAAEWAADALTGKRN